MTAFAGCPHCGLGMRLTLDERYWTCISCTAGRRPGQRDADLDRAVGVFLPAEDGVPPHPLAGAPMHLPDWRPTRPARKRTERSRALAKHLYG